MPPRKRTPEEIRRLKELGAFDAGRTTLPNDGFRKRPEYVPWDGRSDTMPRKRTPEEVRRLKELGAFDAGRTTMPIGGLRKKPVYVPWDEETDPPSQ